MSNNNIFKMLGQEIKECILTKWIGCFVALPAVVLSLIQAIVYGFVSPQDRSTLAIVFSVLAVVLFVALSLFKKTSPLAPVALMVCNFVALLGFASKIVDYYSTVLFGGTTASAFFEQEFAYWYSTLSFIITTIISFVALYLPQNRKNNKDKVEVVNNEIKEV